jgi:lipopolysaccharide/colanic/teichoic acid biosynthesis glycosyltransferase
MKRSFDLILSSLLLIVTAPLGLLVAAAVRLTSPGPVIFAGQRTGKDGKPFLMYKFRSMRVSEQGMAPRITAADDPRITSIGRVLRATKIDEWPQLVNVVRGEMSLVGPRPEAPEYVALYDQRQREVLRVRPGVTGPTQLLYRREELLLRHGTVHQQYQAELMPRKLESDLQYVHHHTFWKDVGLLLRTVASLVQWEGQ